MTTTRPPEGTPCRAELATPDPERAAAFYAAVLGWTLDPDGTATRDGHDVASVHRAEDDTARWTVWFAVDDADAACGRAEELGAGVLHDPEDDGDARVFLVLDPGGAEVGGCETDDAVPTGGGALVGADAASGEPGQSRTFYERLLGWRVEPAERGATIRHADGRLVGTLAIAGDALPHWRPRFAVVDLDAALAAVTVAGGVLVERVDDATAVVGDDAGAPLVLVAR